MITTRPCPPSGARLGSTAGRFRGRSTRSGSGRRGRGRRTRRQGRGLERDRRPLVPDRDPHRRPGARRPRSASTPARPRRPRRRGHASFHASTGSSRDPEHRDARISGTGLRAARLRSSRPSPAGARVNVAIPMRVPWRAAQERRHEEGERLCPCRRVDEQELARAERVGHRAGDFVLAAAVSGSIRSRKRRRRSGQVFRRSRRAQAVSSRSSAGTGLRRGRASVSQRGFAIYAGTTSSTRSAGSAIRASGSREPRRSTRASAKRRTAAPRGDPLSSAAQALR